MKKMKNHEEIAQLCRLCLVTDQVNKPIFEEASNITQILLKIQSCLPVTISQDDNLPKSICDGCFDKLDLLYQFWTTSANSEKQLISWLSEAGIEPKLPPKRSKMATKTEADQFPIKQEFQEEVDDGQITNEYILQQQKLPYKNEFSEKSEDEPPPKRARRAAAQVKVIMDEDSDDDYSPPVTKNEDNSEDDSDRLENDDDDSADFPDEPSTSADQPGPSGVTKAVAEAPFKLEVTSDDVFKTENPEDIDLSQYHKEVNGKAIFQCTHCSDEYESRKRFLQHLDDIDVKNACEPPILSEVPFLRPYQQVANGIVSYLCQKCPYTEISESAFTKHLHEHGIYRIVCRVCDKNFKVKTPYVDHYLIEHENKRYVCTICKSIFKSISGYSIHMQNHRDYESKETYKCPLCANSNHEYKTPHSVRHHLIRTHKELGKQYVGMFKFKRNLPCPKCDKVFHCIAPFEKHVKSHDDGMTDRKKFLCNQCGQVLKKKYSLIEHMKIHTGEKPFSCSTCSKCFKSITLLKLHQNKVHLRARPYLCNLCPKDFSTTTNLRNHLKHHSGIRPFVCGICKKTYCTKSILRLHMKRHPDLVT